MESFSRKLVYRFIKSAAISNNLLYGRRVCSNKQPFLSIVGPAYSRGEILFLGYKWRFFTSFLHSTLILYLIFYPPNPSDMDMNAMLNRLSAIQDEIAQVQYDLSRNLRAMNRLHTRRRIDEDPVIRQRRLSATSARISNLEERERALEAERQALIVQVIEYGHGGN